MKHARLYTIGLMLLGMIALGIGQAGAFSGPGAFYGIPSWDQTLSCITTASCQRFLVLTNMGSQAVLDKETGLVWEQMPTEVFFTNYLWEDAQIHCDQLIKGGRMGWRLPTLQELTSLIDPSRALPALPIGHPFSNVQSAAYWSATTDATNVLNAWALGFASGGVAPLTKSTTYNYVWCVRGGKGVDPQ